MKTKKTRIDKDGYITRRCGNKVYIIKSHTEGRCGILHLSMPKDTIGKRCLIQITFI